MILVTGGAGYVGSVLATDMLRLGESVRVVDLQWFGNPLRQQKGLEVVCGDILEFDPAWLDGVHAVCHLAAMSNDPTADFLPELSIMSNVTATRRLAEAVAERASRQQREIRFVFASSCSVYYRSDACADCNTERLTEDTAVAPSSYYSKSKRMAELELLRVAEQHPRFCPVILRKGTLFGLSPRMRFDLVVNAFTLSAWSERQLTVNGSGEAWRPLLHIQDAVDAYIYLLSAPTAETRCGIFNILHKNYRVLELAHWVAEVLQRHRGVDIRVKRDRANETGLRSYYVGADRLAKIVGFRSERGTTQAVLAIWDALVRGDFGADAKSDSRYFNIRRLRELPLMGEQRNEQLVATMSGLRNGSEGAAT